MKKFLIICAALALLTAAASAQTVEVTVKPLTDSDIQLIRSDVQAGKNDIIAHTMQFTDAESQAFWPVYRDYARDQQVIGDQRLQLIKDYATNYDSMDDAKANGMVQRMIDIEQKTLSLRQAYWPKFMKALGARRAAKFYQVDSRLSLIVNLQLTQAIPLLP
jgi:Spy/CpxP family protein refolding chaperone